MTKPKYITTLEWHSCSGKKPSNDVQVLILDDMNQFHLGFYHLKTWMNYDIERIKGARYWATLLFPQELSEIALRNFKL